MNLSSIGYTRPAPLSGATGTRLDVTLTDTARPGKTSSPDKPAAQIGSIQGVLTPEENRAIAALFGPSSSMYESSGGNARQHAVPGLSLDLQA
ncbi:MAG: hypothetical protein O2954_01070 [bacterium]|nr:hypothetical protein [bacterium]